MNGWRVLVLHDRHGEFLCHWTQFDRPDGKTRRIEHLTDLDGNTYIPDYDDDDTELDEIPFDEEIWPEEPSISSSYYARFSYLEIDR